MKHYFMNNFVRIKKFYAKYFEIINLYKFYRMKIMLSGYRRY